MKRYHSTLLDMFNRLLSFATSVQNQPVTNSIPALQQGITNTLTGKVNAVNALIYAQSEKTTGAAVQKRKFKKTAANLSMLIINGAKALARANKDEVLFSEVDFSFTDLYTFKDNEFADRVNGLMALLAPYQPQLTNYGIQPAAFTDVAAAVANYLTLLSIPRNRIERKKTINQQLHILFKETNDFILNILDPIVLTLKDSQQQYYLQYRAARKHVPHGLRHNRINATVQNELGEPFVDVKVTVDKYTDPDTGKTYEAASGNTDINGMVTVENFWPGNRTVTVTGKDIVTKQFGPYNFKNGNAVDKTLTCQPAYNNLTSPQTTTEKNKTNKNPEGIQRE